MKIVIVGPGAVGLLLAGLLAKSKETIVLLAKNADQAALLKKKGFQITGKTSMTAAAVSVSCSPSDFSSADMWFICVKSYDTKTVAESIAPHVAAGASVVTFQNGLGNVELLTELFGAGRVVAGVTHLGATRVTNNLTRHTGVGETIFGCADGGMAVSLKYLRELFQKAKLPVKISKDINGVLWSKLVINVGINALSGVLRLKNGRLIAYEGSRRILREAVTEAVKVAKRKRIKLLYDDILAKAEMVCEATEDNISSLLADVLRGQKTEIDFLNGAILRHADSMGIKAPVNALLLDLVRTIEASYDCAARTVSFDHEGN